MENLKNPTIVYQITGNEFESLLESVNRLRYENKEIDAKAAAQILGVSYHTVVNWYSKRLLKPCNVVKKGGVIRFRLSDILSIDVKELQKNYRKLNQ